MVKFDIAVVVLVIFCSASGSLAAERHIYCVHQLNECECITNGGHLLDLKKLDSTDVLRPKFCAKADDGYWYEYNPCTPFQDPPSPTPPPSKNLGDWWAAGCKTTAVCQFTEKLINNQKQKVYYPAGYHVSATFQYDLKYGLYVRYHTAAQNVVRTSKVFLGCVPGEDTFEALGELPGPGSGTYVMRLNSKQFCFNVNSTTDGHHRYVKKIYN